MAAYVLIFITLSSVFTLIIPSLCSLATICTVAERDFGYDTNSMEDGQLVRTGNHTSMSSSQTQAMYGRIKPTALEVYENCLFVFVFAMHRIILKNSPI